VTIIPHCKRFTGYKPCEPYKVCYNGCEEPVPYGTRIVIINLDALGTVLITTPKNHRRKGRIAHG